MKHSVYMFEAHSIQSYVLKGGTLRDMVCASELIESLLAKERELDLVLSQLGLVVGQNCWFSRRGGAAFYIFIGGENAASDANRLRDLWYLTVTGIAPDLPFCHVVASKDTPSAAIAAGQAELRIQRNKPTVQPVGICPVMRRVPRTGTAASAYRRREGELIDRATNIKRHDYFVNASLLNKKFTPENHKLNFPENMDPEDVDDELEHAGTLFPFEHSQRRIAVLHADGNGLGQILSDLGEHAGGLTDVESYSKVYMSISLAIAEATQLAARHSIDRVVIGGEGKYDPANALPIRPLIMGGDDLTVVIRADRALEFTTCFIEEFENQTEIKFKEVAVMLEELPGVSDISLPKRLTSCAGLAFIRANQPFALGYTLAETVCSAVKQQARQRQEQCGTQEIPSALGFHRVTSTLIEEYESAMERENTAVHGKERYRLTLGAYGVGVHSDSLPRASALLDLIDAFEEQGTAPGPLRQLSTTMHTSLSDAKKMYTRWRKNLSKNDETLCERYERCHQQLSQHFESLGETEMPENDAVVRLPFFDVSNSSAQQDPEQRTYVSYLGDLIHALSVGSKLVQEREQ